MRRKKRAKGLKGKLSSGFAGAMAGRATSRAMRPVTTKLARRLGLPTRSVAKIIEIAAPLFISMVVARMVKRKAAKMSEASGEKSGAEPPGAQEMSAASAKD